MKSPVSKLVAAIGLAALGGGAYLATTAPSTPTAPAQPAGTKQLTGANGAGSRSCTYTNPEYMFHAGGATIDVYPASTRFSVQETSTPGLAWDDPYVTAGYNNSSSSVSCAKRIGPGYRDQASTVPVAIGQQGSPIASIHTFTQPGFYGDTGYDLWFEPSPTDNTYTEMSDGGSDSTEIMIWTSNNISYVINSLNLKLYPVVIDGLHWYVQTGLAADGHGVGQATPNGWNVVNFIAPVNHIGNVTLADLPLDPFVSYSIAHGYLNPADYWEGVNAGAELSDGNFTLAGYSLTGLK